MRKLIASVLYSLFSLKINREIKRKDRILSIYGHNPSRESFDQLIQWFVSQDFHFVTIEELFQYLEGHELKSQRNVWLSFDDGWKSNYDNVFPVLKKYNIPATIFVATKGIIDGYFWFDKAFQNRQSEYYKEIQELWEMPNQKRQEIVSKLPFKNNERLTMIPKELSEMDESGLISWGNHTHDHVMSDKCSEKELTDEIKLCGDFLEQWIGERANFIYSYPNGNQDALSIKVIKKLNFSLAASTIMGNINHDTDKYLLPRNEFKDDASLKENILQCFGIWTPLFNMVKHMLFIKNKK